MGDGWMDGRGWKKPPTERDRIRFRIWGFVSHKMMFREREGGRETERACSSSCGLVLFSKSVTRVPNEKGTPRRGSGTDFRTRLRERRSRMSRKAELFAYDDRLFLVRLPRRWFAETWFFLPGGQSGSSPASAVRQ